MDVRNPVVAGHFYPADSKKLQQELQKYLTKKDKINKPLATIVPHAGYVYSGKTAGLTYSRVNVPDAVIVMCPNHTGLGYPISLHPAKKWLTPLGEINVEMNILEKIKKTIPQAEFDASAQAREHSLEVQLPFIQMCNPKAKIVPITLSDLPMQIIQKLGAVLCDIIVEHEANTGTRPLIVASSDMTHFENADRARAKDMLVVEQIKKLNTKGFIDVISSNDITVCGVFPISVTLEVATNYARKKGVAMYADLVDYTNSGIVTGDKDSVVAYAGVIIHG